MSTMRAVHSVDFSNREKLSFVATVLPLLGAIGGILRIKGWSEEATLVAILPPLFIAFFVWRYATSRLETRKVDLLTDQVMWEQMSERLESRRKELVAAQQEELRQLGLRQKVEQERLMKTRASQEQLGRMMDRHREEYEELLQRRTA
jgi:hypothetical protein